MEHRGAIENVLNRYALAYDEDDMSDMADCFTQDASFSMRIQDGDLIGPFEGREAIVKLMRDSMEAQTDRRRHLTTNIVVSGNGDGRATASSYLTLVSVENGTLTVLSSGRYVDELVQDGDAWRIARRHLDLDLPY
ncbi:nuclear transport factor 2 family protein [Georgenia sp. AZ-5]|uniref:nuclear transport factor 2 family protein n=1 Tax=Georgenia sp. AZ-5 TaxID=3367526 RepID=UPI003754370F